MKKPMGRTIVVMDKETNKLWIKAAKRKKISKSLYVRELIRKDAEENKEIEKL